MNDTNNLQINAITKNAYVGANQAELLEVKRQENYQSNEWVTFIQAKTLGKKLVNAKGKGVRLLRFSYDDEVAVDEKGRAKGFVKGFTVFNTDLLVDLEEHATI